MLINDLRKAERFAANWRCRHCDDSHRLVVRWNWDAKQHEVGCLNCGAKAKGDFYRPPSLTKQYFDDPESLPPGIRGPMANKYRKQIEAAVTGLPPEIADSIRRKFGLTVDTGERWEGVKGASEDGAKAAVDSNPAPTATGEGGRSQGASESGTQAGAAESPNSQAERGSYIVSSQEWDW